MSQLATNNGTYKDSEVLSIAVQYSPEQNKDYQNFVLKMPPSTTSSKYFLRELSLIRLYTVLLISFLYFIVQMVIAHMAHSLILQVDAYHMLYNILALATSIITTKMCRKGSSLKNTFGWTRIDVCGAVASICFLAASCFSIIIEALQAMLHSSHHENMKMPIPVLSVGLIGIFTNTIAYAIIGGYTRQQKSFLGSHRDGQDIVISPSARRGPSNPKLKCGGPLDVLRDFLGCILVVVVALVIHLWKHEMADFVDPSIAIIEIFILAILSYKYAKEAGHILLLTIPENINVQSLLDELYQTFPEISDVHEWHVWQLDPSRVIATAHVVLKNTDNCWIVQNNIIEFLESKGITSVTLQPEFLELQGQAGGTGASPETLRKRQCFLPCHETEDCYEKKCCLSEHELALLAQKETSGHNHGHSHDDGHSHEHKKTWTWSNPLKSSSLNNVSSQKDDALLNPPRMTAHSHEKKSNPELAKEKNAIVVTEIRPKGPTPELVPPPSQEDSSESSDEDEDHKVRKPMI